MAGLVEIRVPDLGDYKDVEVIDVPVKAGDVIAQEGSLITLETEKATMDVPSTAAGTIREIKIKRGDRVSKGDLIALVEPAQQEAPAAAATGAASAAPAPAATQQSPPRARQSPSVSPRRQASVPPRRERHGSRRHRQRPPGPSSTSPVFHAPTPARRSGASRVSSEWILPASRAPVSRAGSRRTT